MRVLAGRPAPTWWAWEVTSSPLVPRLGLPRKRSFLPLLRAGEEQRAR